MILPASFVPTNLPIVLLVMKINALVALTVNSPMGNAIPVARASTQETVSVFLAPQLAKIAIITPSVLNVQMVTIWSQTTVFQDAQITNSPTAPNAMNAPLTVRFVTNRVQIGA